MMPCAAGLPLWAGGLLRMARVHHSGMRGPCWRLLPALGLLFLNVRDVQQVTKHLPPSWATLRETKLDDLPPLLEQVPVLLPDFEHEYFPHIFFHVISYHFASSIISFHSTFQTQDIGVWSLFL